MRADSKRLMTPEQREVWERRIAAAVESGVPRSTVARAYKVNHNRVSEICAERGVVVPQPRRRNWL
jgi:hypothetical protein